MNSTSTLKCSWGHIHLRQWHQDLAATPILAIHGWLDNSAAFEPLADILHQPIIAIDLPGHGFSSHLPAGNWYHFVDYCVRLHEIIQNLGLEKFHLLGHSMGAGVAALYAATFPEQINKLILVDGAGPMINEAEDAPEILRQSIISRNKTPRRPRLMDLPTAIKLRLSGSILSPQAAEILVKGQILPEDGQYRWSYDEKVNYISPLRMSPPQLSAFFKKITCPALLIKASKGLISKSNYAELVDDIPGLISKTVAGSHHIHMDQADETAALIREFLG